MPMSQFEMHHAMQMAEATQQIAVELHEIRKLLTELRILAEEYSSPGSTWEAVVK